MLTHDDFRKRANALFESCRDRWRKRLEKGLPKGAKLELAPDLILPFTRLDFQKWLWQTTGLQAFPCRYCRAPIDIISLSLDHLTPLRRGGGPELSNLGVCCSNCNSIKGQFTHEEFTIMVAFFEGPAAHFRQRLEGLLKNGNMATMTRFFPRKGKDNKTPKVVQTGLAFELDDF